MRRGSGAVVLVGFALVVMLLSVVSVMNKPVMLIKQDPSQDFVDIAGSIKDITYACGNFRGGDDEKINYYNKTLTMLSNQLKRRGLILEVYPMVASYKCSVLYILRSADNSTYIQGFVSTDASLESAWKQHLAGGSLGSLSSLIIIPPALCFRDVGQGEKKSSTHFLMSNPNPIRINIILKYVGDDYVKELHVSFPGQGKEEKEVRDDDNDGDLEFYLDPMTEPKGKGVALGQRTVGDAHITIVHNTAGQSSKLVLIVVEYNFEQDIPIYWNSCPVVSWGQVLKSLRTGG
jgi:hypothetical protein